MNAIRLATALLCLITSAILLWMGWDYAYGSGYGLHPGIVGGAVMVLGICGWKSICDLEVEEIDYCDCFGVDRARFPAD